jgi:O-antigen/teichoic acid export membrane protein
VIPIARPDGKLLRAQLAFALPFAGASWLYVGQRYFGQYAVSAHFDAATFALYTVAAFHLPVVDIVFTPLTEVLMVQLGATLGRDRRASMRHWHDCMLKLATMLFPAAAGAWLFGPSLLPLLFTRSYSAAVPLFLLTSVEIPLWILPLDALLRAAGDTRFLFALNAARVAVTAAFVVSGIFLAGLPGAIVGAILSETLARAAMLERARQFLDGPLIDWRALARIAAAAALACVPGWAILEIVPGLRGLVAAMAAYGIAYLVLVRSAGSPSTAALRHAISPRMASAPNERSA